MFTDPAASVARAWYVLFVATRAIDLTTTLNANLNYESNPVIFGNPYPLNIEIFIAANAFFVLAYALVLRRRFTNRFTNGLKYFSILVLTAESVFIAVNNLVVIAEFPSHLLA